MTCALGTSRGSADNTPSTSVQMMICAACSNAPNIDPEKSLPLRPSVVCMPAAVVATKPGDDEPALEPCGNQPFEVAFARRPLHRRTQRPPFDDHDLAGIHPLHVAVDAASLPQERRKQPRRPDFTVPGDHVPHRLRRRPDEAHGLQHAGDIAGNPVQLRIVDGTRARRHSNSRREAAVPRLERSRCAAQKSAPGRSARLTSAQQRVGDAPARGQHHGLARIGGCLDDRGYAPETPASATLDPPNLCTIHLSIFHTRVAALRARRHPVRGFKLMNCGLKPLDSPEL